MNTMQFKSACDAFISIAAPYLKIEDEQHYHEALELIELLMVSVGENNNDPMDLVIDMLAKAIEEYESQDSDVIAFEEQVAGLQSGIAVLKVLMDQHKLGVADLPEIGSKSMVSRVLSGERELSKKHIEGLSERFEVPPGLFF